MQQPAPLLEDDAPSENYALRLTEALEAIQSVEDGRPVRQSVAETANNASLDQGAAHSGNGTFARWLKTLDALPPIRLPIGPAIPWRLGLPVFVASVALTVAMSRPSAHADAQSVHVPTPEPYAVQHEAPLFTNAAAQAQGAAPIATDLPVAQPALGVPESPGSGFDAADIAFKLIAVLALAYGCLLLLKRAGFGGASAARTGSGTPVMRVVSSLALAPNRSVHVLKVPGGKTLLVGATPNQVNLIADLGELAEADSPEATSFFDILKGKIGN